MRHVTCGGVDWQVDEPHFDGWSFWDDWERADFEPHTLATVDRFVKPGTTFVDIGAWISPVTLWAARTGARVVAVEPDPEAAKFLYFNVNNNYANVSIFEGAISDTTGACRIKANPAGWASSMTQVADDGEVEVPCLTLPDLFDIYDIEDCSLVKVDVEGHEAVLLEHAAPFLADLKIPLLVSMHQPWWSRDVDRSWFDGFSTIEGEIGGWSSVLALP